MICTVAWIRAPKDAPAAIAPAVRDRDAKLLSRSSRPTSSLVMLNGTLTDVWLAGNVNWPGKPPADVTTNSWVVLGPATMSVSSNEMNVQRLICLCYNYAGMMTCKLSATYFQWLQSQSCERESCLPQSQQSLVGHSHRTRTQSHWTWPQLLQGKEIHHSIY